MPKGKKPIKTNNTIHKNRIKEAAAKNNMTIPELAKKIDMKASALRPYTRQERQPRLNLAEKIANTCNVSVSFVLGVENYSVQKFGIEKDCPEVNFSPDNYNFRAVSKTTKLPLFNSHSMDKPINHIDSPPWLVDAERGYALYIQNDELSPRLNAGDIAFIEPSLPVRKGDTAITFDKDILPSNSSRGKYLILRFNEYKNGIYSFQTLRDNKELNISEPQYKNIHRITGINFT
ncbi:MAG: helix-turn-helix domain-containing protein [Alphaproteobacteria bacterium]